MPEYFLISGGYVYDPANGIDGQVKDLWISGGKIVEPPSDPAVRPDARRSTPRAWSSCRAASTCTATSPGRR